jgi:hypothetical protein
MNIHFQYGRYVLRHKWFVFRECCKAGIVWRGITHDLSKLRPDEWFPYARYFYGSNQPRRDSTGYYKPTDTGDIIFDHAWLLHQKRNDHHWQWWILPEGDGGIKVLPMSETARSEMLCDWRGASRAQGYGDNTVMWYIKNCGHMQLHPETRGWIEGKLGLPK